MHILNGHTLRHNKGAQTKYQANIQRWHPSSLYLRLLVWHDSKLGFHTLGWEKRNDSVMEINRAQDTEAMPSFRWLYMSLLQQYRMLRGIHPKSTEIYPDLRWLSHSGYKFQGLFYVNNTAYSSLPNMRIREEYLKKKNKNKTTSWKSFVLVLPTYSPSFFLLPKEKYFRLEQCALTLIDSQVRLSFY